MNANVTIMNLLPIICTYQELELISQLNSFFNFDHNIFFIENLADVNRYINSKSQTEFIPQSVHVVNNFADNMTELEILKEMKSKNSLVIVVSNSSIVDSKSNLRFIKEIRRERLNVKIGVFLSQVASSEDLQTFFESCWEFRMIDIFVATYENYEVAQESNHERLLNIFTFNPFGTFDVINVTGSESFVNIFLTQNPNFRLHTLKVGRKYYGPSAEKMWLTVFRFMNASSIFVPHNKSRAYFTRDRIDILPQMYTQNELQDLILYPSQTISMVILVPEALAYAEFMAYLQTVTSDKFFGYFLLVIVVVMLLLSISRYMKRSSFLFCQSIADVMNLILNDNGAIKYQQLSHTEAYLIVPMTFLGLIFVNGLLSTLKSFLTRPVSQRQINTIEDVYNSKDVIWCTEDWVSDLIGLLTGLAQHADWNDRVYGVKKPILNQQSEMFDRSRSYLYILPYAISLLTVQKRLNLKGFYIPQTKLAKYHVSSLVTFEFPFIERLIEIFHRIKSAGLYAKWVGEDYHEYEAKVIKEYINNFGNREVEVEAFSLPIFIVYGWLAGVIVLIIEIVWKKFKFSRFKVFFSRRLWSGYSYYN